MIGDIDRAIESLRGGGLVIVPTDTVYGLATMPGVAGTIEAVYRAKGRPEEKPLPVLGASIDALAAVVAFDDLARRLAESHWPGPLTIVLPRARGFDAHLGGVGTRGVGVRIPACEPALALLARSGPLAVTSANRSGEAPATTAEEARRAVGGAVEVVIDAGRCDGVPSTVLSLIEEPEILRSGPLDVQIRSALAGLGVAVRGAR